jgi:mono/diheme cytochrome c family protein
MFRGKHRSRAGILSVLALLLAACESSEPQAPLSYSPPGPVPEEAQRPGDPQKGYDALVNNAYLTCGIPYSAYRKSAPPPAVSERLPGRRGKNAELPYNRTFYTTPDGVDLAVDNCLVCHAGAINGQRVVGLGDESLDFTGDLAFAAESVGAFVENDQEAAEWKRWADIVRTAAPYIRTDTVGVNPAVNLTLALTAHRDPETLAWSEKPLLEPPPVKPAPVSVPPWWRLAKKNALYYRTEARGDQARAMMLGAIFCADDVETLRAIDAYAPDIRAYFASIKPPAYPFPIDAALAGRGRAVFEKTCSVCHGTYGAAWTYPNRVVGLAEVGTDPALATAATNGETDRFQRWFNRSFFGELARAAPAPGYIAPPLDGVWATAPFLHNGSVPTIAALLESSRRPRYWTRSFDSRDYDSTALGWNYTELPYGKDGEPDAGKRKRIYDTTLPGYSSQGHTFGDGLTEDERGAVLEYLKTL